MAHILAKDLRDAVLQAAVQGKLTTTFIYDTKVTDTISELKGIKESLIKNRIIRNEKILPIEEEDIDYNIPDTWRFVRLGDTIRLLSGQDLTSDRYSSKHIGIPYLTGASNFVDGRLIINRYTSSGTSIAKKGSLLITCKGTIGEMAFLEFDEAHIARQIMAIIPLGKMNIHYIKLCLRNLIRSLNSKAKSIIPGIDRETILNCLIPFPPIEEQARIVTKVDELMAKIDEYEKLENELVELKKNFPGDMKAAVLQAAMEGKLTEQFDSEYSPFVDEKANTDEYDYNLPNNWNVVRMTAISDLYTGNSIPESVKKTKYTNLSSGLNYIGTKDVGFDNSINYENGVKIPFDESKFRVAYKNATLLCIEGGSAGKKVGIISEDVCFGNKLCSFNASKFIDYKFQYYIIQSPIFKKMFSESLSGMIGGVSLKKIKEILIPLPPIEEQQRIVKKIDKLLPLCNALGES